MKIGFSTMICPDFSLQEICELARKTDCYHLEFQVGKDQNHGIDKLAIDSPERDKIKKRLFESNLKPQVLATYVHLNRKSMDNLEQTISRLKKWARVARELQVPYLRVFPLTGYEKDKNKIRMIRRVSEAMKKYPVEILIENHGSMSTGQEVGKTLDKAEVDNINAIWDIAHTVEHGETVNETYNYIAPYLKHVHFKDFAKVKKEEDSSTTWDKFVPFGQGDMPLKEMIKVLKTNDYQGVVSVEVKATYGSPEEYLKGAKELLNQ